MRWPSVYFWGWFMGIPGLLLCFVGSLYLAGAESMIVERVLGSSDIPFVAYFAVTLIVVGFAAYKLVDCPRCATSAYWHSGTRWSNAWPEKRCSRCDLDLRKFHPFDSRAKREPHV